MPVDDVKALLRERGAQTIDHPGSTLYRHLVRVHDRLAAHGLPEPTALAGLAHAAYGTDGFDTTLLTRDERDLLRAVAELAFHRRWQCRTSAAAPSPAHPRPSRRRCCPSTGSPPDHSARPGYRPGPRR
ncbi:DUF6817 domain-containing protein [Catellatospora methionotrophica]|uniref:DUF6817 domain-containing protein n=1 Tax=Catellatospora methionotrophica TaxID=121620 RepID=UPI001408E855|nr:hypothetical protein [Catellatospora methionotrophica]